MAAIISLTINDGEATPLPHVFNPIVSVPPTFRRNNVADQAVIAQERLLMQTIMAKARDGVNKVQIELVVPVSEVPAGGTGSGYTAPPAVAHEQRAKLEFFFHNRSVKQGRKNLRVMLSNLLINPLVVSLVDDLEQPY